MACCVCAPDAPSRFPVKAALIYAVEERPLAHGCRNVVPQQVDRYLLYNLPWYSRIREGSP